jgi:phage terminase large subunit-like protein
MLAVQGDWVVATCTAGKGSTGKYGNGAEVFGVAACKAEAHSATVGETKREAEVLVDAEVVLDCLADCVEEGDVFAIGVAPALVESIRSHEDGTLLCKSLEAVVWGAPAVDRVHVTTQPVQTEDEFVGLGVVVVGGDSDDPLALLAVDGHSLGTTFQGWRFPAACCTGIDTLQQGAKEEQAECEESD